MAPMDADESNLDLDADDIYFGMDEILNDVEPDEETEPFDEEND